MRFLKISLPKLLYKLMTDTCDVAHSIGVQNDVLPFFCLQEPIYNVLVIFFALKVWVYVRLVVS